MLIIDTVLNGIGQEKQWSLLLVLRSEAAANVRLVSGPLSIWIQIGFE